MKFQKILLSVFVLFLGLVLAPSLFAQGSNKYAPKDSINIRKKHLLRQWSYENNLSSFPPPKKNNWSFGGGRGASFIAGDVRPELAFAWNANIRKAFGHLFSLRAQFVAGQARGLNYRQSKGYQYNPALNGTNNAAALYQPGDSLFYNYQNKFMDLSIQGVFTFNNVNFYKKKIKWNWYAFAGIGGVLYQTKVDALDANGNAYDYSGITRPADRSEIKTTLNQLSDFLDGEYETEAELPSFSSSLGERTLIPAGMVGGGLAYRLNRRIDVALEHRVTFTNNDVLDGQRWSEQSPVLTPKPDLMHYSSLALNFRIGKGEDAYWWTNPLAGPYEQIRQTKVDQKRSVKDSDGDGVVDALDKERNTPANAAVDVKGVALDSDADGVADFRDDEPFSPKGAKVDKKGIARDGDNDGVPDIFDLEKGTEAGASVDPKGRTVTTSGSGTGISEAEAELLLPMVNFDYAKSEIKPEFFPSLYYIARVMGARPDLKLKVIGHADTRNKSGKNQEISERRAQAVVDFLNGNFGIEKTRFVIEGKAANQTLIKGVPEKKNTESEGYHYLNRRVEFEIIK